jgi:DNA polymerase-3 subunit gamma/tau
MLVRSAPAEPAVLDVPPDRYQRLAAQAAKFTVAELSRILALLIAAQTDMRWTTSPRLTLELALVRGAVPEADPNPAGLAARIERLERLAGVEVRTPEAGGLVSAGQDPPVRHPIPPPEEPEAAGHVAADDHTDAAQVQPHAPDAESLDIATIRRSWQQLLDRLLERRQMILRANLESVTAAAYDGTTLELAFPPGRKFAVQKVQSKESDLREAFADVFGVSPRIQCVARDGVPGMAMVEEDDPPAGPEDALARLKAEFGAEVEKVEESPPAEQGA